MACCLLVAGTALETSLVEWKHSSSLGNLYPQYPLETSLVEWKHVARTAPARSGGALETSLVEWKP